MLLFIEPVDEWVAQGLNEFNQKKLRAIHKGDFTPPKVKTPEGETAAEEPQAPPEKEQELGALVAQRQHEPFSEAEIVLATEKEWAGPRGWQPPTNRIEDDGYAHVLIDEARHDRGPGDIQLDGTGGDIIADGDDGSGRDAQAGRAADAIYIDDPRMTQDQISRLWRAPRW